MSATTDVRERPILFSAPMVRALLDGTKTQTRRVVKAPGMAYPGYDARADECLRCPYGARGDRLWVRETWAVGRIYDRLSPSQVGSGPLPGVRYPATQELRGLRFRPSIFMPRWASRLTLELTDVRLARVQDISAADAEAEGILSLKDSWKQDAARRAAAAGQSQVGPRDYFREVWDCINAPRDFGWNANPWVWALTFRRVTG